MNNNLLSSLLRKSFLRFSFLFVALVSMSSIGFGQLLQWNTFGNAGTETTEPSVSNNANISAANLTQGTITAAANTNRFGGSNWFNTGNTNPSTLANAIAGNDYIQFIVTPNSGFSFTPTSFVFNWDKSGTGPQNVALRSSFDGYAADLGTVVPTAAIATANTITITGLTALTTATTFRLYGYGATATTGTGGFDIGTNVVNVQLNGSTASLVTNYTVTYNGNTNDGGTAPVDGSSPYASASTVTVLGAGSLTKTGYTFSGWNTIANGSGTSYAPAATFSIGANTTLYAQWTAINYTLTYDGNTNSGGTAPSAGTHTYLQNVTLPNQGTLTKTGYTFVGWNTLANGTGTDYAAGANYSMPAANATLYAKWSTVNYTLTYDGNTQTSGTAPSSGSYIYQQNVVLPSQGSLLKTGYTFGGWNTLANGTGTNYAVGANYSMPATNTTLYAKWNINSYTVTYDGNTNDFGTAPVDGSSPYNYGSNVTVLSEGDLTKDGYTFNGWNTAANGSGTAYIAGGTISGIAANTILYAQWTLADTYTVLYNGNGNTGGSAPVDGSSPYLGGDNVTVLDEGDLVKTNYTFAGWNTAPDGSGTAYATNDEISNISASVILYAQWAINTYTVTYNGNTNTGGSAPVDGSSPYDYGSNVTVLGAGSLVKTNYNFTGWNTAANGSGTSYAPAATISNITANVTLYAQWSIITYTVTYDGNTNTGGTAPVDGSSPYAIGSTVTVLGAGSLVKTGYSFTGWNTAANGSGTSYAPAATFSIAANTILYAQWTINSYTVTYDGNTNDGGSAPIDGSSPYIYNTTVTVLGQGSLTKTNYNFTGWNTAANGSGTSYAPAATFAISADVTLYAQWSIITYTVTYNGNTNTGGTAPVDGSSPYATGSTVTVLGAGSLVKTGYTFSGWNTAANGSGTAYAAAATFTITGNTTLYAQWTINTYTVTYNGNSSTGGTAPVDGSSPYNYGSNVTVLGVGTLVKTGSVFTGWNTVANGSGTSYAAGATISAIAANITLYAQWFVPTLLQWNTFGNAGTETTEPSIFNDANISATNLTQGTITAAGNANRFGGSGWWNTGNTVAGNTIAEAVAGNDYIQFIVTPNAGIGFTPTSFIFNWDKSASGPQNVALRSSADGYASNLGTVVPTASIGTSNTITITGLGPLTTATTFRVYGYGATATGGTGGFDIGSNVVNVELKGTTASYYAVTYNGNTNTGGTAPVDGSSPYLAGSNVTVLGVGTLVKTGYTFTGWNTIANGSGTPYAAGATISSIAATTTLYAQWTINTYTVTYDGNTNTAGTAPVDGSSPYNFGSNVTVLGAGSLVKTGYSFVNWNTAANGSGTSYAAGATISAIAANITLYAQWALDNVYTVTYNGNTNTSGTAPVDNNSPYTGGSNVTVLDSATLVKTGYYFNGWNTAANGSGTAYAIGSTITAIAANTILYAQWTIHTYTVTYNGNTNTGGTAPVDGSSPYNYGSNVTVLGAGSLVKTNYNFTGWNTAANGSGTSYAPAATISNITSNITLYAQWSIITYTVTYDGNTNTGGTAPVDGSSPYAIGSNVTVLGVGTLVKTGYSFTDWNTAADGSGTSYAPSSTITSIAANITLYAQWSINSYTVTYNGNGNTGGTAPVDGSSPYTFGSTVTVLTNSGSLVKTGYTFVGWNTATDGTGTDRTPGGTFNLGGANVVLYAKWAASLYEGFAYTAGGNVGGNCASSTCTGNNWTTHSTSLAGTINVTAGSLSYTGLKASTGNKINIPGANGTVSRDINRGAGLLASQNTTYYSFLLNVTDATQLATTFGTGGNGYFVHLSASSGTSPGSFSAKVHIRSSSSATKFRLGISETGNIPTEATGDLNFGTSYLVVVKYVYNNTAGNDLATMWVNPSSLGGAEASGGVTGPGSANLASYNSAATAICIRNASATPKADIDEIRLGSTWSEVTPVSTHTVSYDGNGNTAGTAPTDGSSPYTHNSTVTVLANSTLIKTGSTFTGWNTIANGSGTAYAAGATFSITTDVTLYAQWCSGNTYTGTNSDFGNNANWSCGVAPGSGSSAGVVINSGTGKVTLNTNYDVKDGSFVYNGGAAGDTLIIAPGIRLQASGSGTINFNGHPVLIRSSFAGTGSIGTIAGTLSGATNVTAERYIRQNTYRGWRLMAVPVAAGSQTIRQSWQEGATSYTEDPHPGYGTRITANTATAVADG
ncbi:MAG: InlB B-repeat-containing protein, partial [Bacteroidota bacterium]